MLRASDLDYELPPDLIATEPVSPRDAARLLIVDRHVPDAPRHAAVRDLPDVLRPSDVLVFNTTRVLPARFFGKRSGTGGKVEGLFLHDDGAESPISDSSPVARWITLLRGRHLRAGAAIELFDGSSGPSPWTLTVTGRHEPGAWTADIHGPPSSTPAILDHIGRTPLPPYIIKARQLGHFTPDESTDRDRYQTVYADAPGSVAAPTAGLHFTPELLNRLRARGIGRLDVLLHVGAGTFKPIETEFVEDHPMHGEWCSMTAAPIASLLEARSQGRRIIAVGTTAARTLESYAAIAAPGKTVPNSMETHLLITPGFKFRWIDGLLTNFHLPRSTLLALVAAFLPGPGIATLLRLYAEAIARRYRFYSFGDAMLIT